MASKDVMIDIETMATTADALVLSIGAIEFTCDNDQAPSYTGSSLMVVPSFFEQLLRGRRVDRDTQLWWSKQNPEAAKHWMIPDETLSVVSALTRLEVYMADAARVWCRGTHFDVAILDSLYAEYGIRSPWKYNAPRDVRSFTEQRDRVRMLASPGIDGPIGPAHHPLADCKAQILDLWEHGLKPL